MGVIRTKVGNAEVLIETVDTKMNESFSGMADTGNKSTISDKVYDVFENAKEVIQGVVQEVSEIVVQDINPPDETKVSFGMSLSTEGNLWLIKSGGSLTLNVELTWKRSEKDA